MFEKHCNDEALLAYQDGELSGRGKRRVQQHLESCWICRGRQAALQQQIHALADAFQGARFPDSDWLAGARSRFPRCQERFEAAYNQAPRLACLRAMSRRPWAAVAGVAAACLLVFAVLFLSTKPAVQAAAIIERSRAAEADLSARPLHQVLHVQFRQTRPITVQRDSRLLIWSDAPRGRFAARWEEQGRLKYAAWRDGQRNEYVHNPAAQPGVVRWTGPARALTAADLATEGWTIEELEGALIAWLQSRPWRSVSFTSDLAVFSAGEGGSLAAERVRASDGRVILRLVARRQTARYTAELVVELDPSNYLPRMQSVRFQAAEHAVELRIVADRLEPLAPAQMKAALFRPDAGLAPAVPLVPRPAERLRQPVDNAPAAASQAAGLLAREVEVHVALHRLGACLGEPVEVATQPDGHILVRALAETAKRQEEIVEALAGLPHVQAEVRTVQEAASAEPANEHWLALESESVMRVASPVLPIQQQLERYFRQQGTEEGGRQIAALANQAIVLSEQITEHAWAIQRLASAFPPSRTTVADHETLRLLREMLDDHLRAYRGKVEAASSLLAPVLESFAARAEPDTGGGTGTPDAAWPDGAVGLLNFTEKTDELVRGLFAGAALRQTPEKAGGALRARLLVAGQAANGLEAALAAQLSQPPGRPSTHFTSTRGNKDGRKQ
jgi:hypothetical protein